MSLVNSWESLSSACLCVASLYASKLQLPTFSTLEIVRACPRSSYWFQRDCGRRWNELRASRRFPSSSGSLTDSRRLQRMWTVWTSSAVFSWLSTLTTPQMLSLLHGDLLTHSDLATVHAALPVQSTPVFSLDFVAKVDSPIPAPLARFRLVRNWRCVDVETFAADLLLSDLVVDSLTTSTRRSLVGVVSGFASATSAEMHQKTCFSTLLVWWLVFGHWAKSANSVSLGVSVLSAASLSVQLASYG